MRQGTIRGMRLDDAWNAQASEWIRFARDPRGDRTNVSFNLPTFLGLVPPPGRTTLDLGCGERGRSAAATSSRKARSTFQPNHRRGDGWLGELHSRCSDPYRRRWWQR
jgi:hypothetical protein